VVVYEFLEQKFYKCAANWRRAIWCGELMVDELSDPTKTYLDVSPYFEEKHVANEQ
jgi:hypothetical protein